MKHIIGDLKIQNKLEKKAFLTEEEFRNLFFKVKSKMADKKASSKKTSN